MLLRTVADGLSCTFIRDSFPGLLLVLLLCPAMASGQNVEPIECQDGDVLAGSYEDVIVNGGLCTLDGATVFGAVLVDGGAVTTTPNGARILAGISLNGGGDVTLEAVDVLGAISLERSGSLILAGDSKVEGVSMKESGDVTIGASASTGQLLVEKSGEITVLGAVAAILSTESGGITLRDARVFPGGVSMSSSSGSLEICGSEIGINSDTQTDGSGVVKVLGDGEVRAVASESCGASQIEGAVIVLKGTGSLRLLGAELLAGDLIVAERTGEVSVGRSTLSDVKIEKITGSVTLTNVFLDSDTTIAEVGGDVTIASSEIDTSLGGDVEVKFARDVTMTSVVSQSDLSFVNNRAIRIEASEVIGDMNVAFNDSVTVAANSFALEDVRVASNTGPVVIDRNCDMRLTIVENHVVALTNNNPTDAMAAGATCVSGFGFSDADVTKNTGGVLIVNNTGEGLFCSDNDPAPTGSGNIVTFSDGQCAGL